MKDLFLTVVEISLSTGFILLILFLFSSYLSGRYAAKWKYLIWIAIAVRLIIPLNFGWPVPKIVVDVPTRMTAPINPNAGNEMPILLQTDPNSAQITLLDIAANLWLAGCLLFLAVHIGSFLHFRKQVLRDGQTVTDEEILRSVYRLSGELHIKPDLQVVRYPEADSPMLIGFCKPVLVLPDYRYNEEELYFILKHELIHLKRHDIYFKLLFVTANAMHWFNPLVYVMQREAVIDMELSCDERVIRQTSYAVRRAYTEALFSTLSRQHKKETTLTTQFYGDKKVMEKRFKNILMKSEKRNGLVISICAICFTLVSGMLVGCSSASDIPSGVQAQVQFREETPDAQTEEPQDIPVTADAEKGQENAKRDGSDAESPEALLPDDSAQIKRVIEEFAAAYFSGDINAVRSLLPDSYTWDIEAYDGAGTISDITVKGLPDAGEQEVGSVRTVSMQYRDSTYEDMFQYLTFELIKQSTGWEIQFYGLEG